MLTLVFEKYLYFNSKIPSTGTWLPMTLGCGLALGNVSQPQTNCPSEIMEGNRLESVKHFQSDELLGCLGSSQGKTLSVPETLMNSCIVNKIGLLTS